MMISPQQLLSLTNDSYMVANRFINSTYWPRSWMKWNVYSLTRTLIHSLTHIPCVYVVQSNSTPWVLAKDPPRKKHTKKKKEKKSPLWVLFVCLFVYFEHERKREKKTTNWCGIKSGYFNLSLFAYTTNTSVFSMTHKSWEQKRLSTATDATDDYDVVGWWWWIMNV